MELEPTTQPTGEQEAPEGATPTTDKQEPQQSVPAGALANLDDDPRFRKWKSETSKQISARDNSIRQLESNMQQLREELTQTRMQSLPDADKVNYQIHLMQEQNQQLQRALAARDTQDQKWRDLLDISTRTGAPISELEDATDNHDAWIKGWAWGEANGTAPSARKQRETETRSTPKVDTGSGKASSAAEELQAKYDKLMKENNTWDALDVMAEASRQGVELTSFRR